MTKEEIQSAKNVVADSLKKINAIDAKITEFQEQYKKLVEMKKKGISVCAKALKSLDKDLRDECLAETEENLASEIKKNMFVFSDIAKLDKRHIQKILFNCQVKDIALAVKLIDGTEVKKHIYSNLSKNNVQQVREEEKLLGDNESVDKSECAKAQRKIIDTAIALEEKGEIFFPDGF